MSVRGIEKNRCLLRYTYTYVYKTSDSHKDLTTVTSGEEDGLGDRREFSVYRTVYCSRILDYVIVLPIHKHLNI